jgi:Acetyltransferase (GNAT) domain
LRVERYTADHEQEWNEFVGRSKNGTFLFDRGYMEYHRDRFADYSLLVRDDRGRLVTVLPASRHKDVLISHGGLTYGGFVSGDQMTTRRMLDVFDACLQHIRHDEIDRLLYKCVPHIYHSCPAEEDGYALFVHDARLVRRDVSSAIDTRAPLSLRKGRHGVVQGARRAGLYVEQMNGFDRFWPVLEQNLVERHGTKPVHTLDEITYLAGRFPENILLFVCAVGEEILAGSVVYLSTNVCHVQYNGASAEGRRQGALDLVLAEVIDRFSSTYRVIDFGISTERGGRLLNGGLIDYKEGFGGRAVNYDFYEMRIAPDG